MIIGFTGTRYGMSCIQLQRVKEILISLKEKERQDDRDIPIGLHGGCVGADADFDELCHNQDMETHCRPCTFENMRAETKAKQIAEPKTPMQRNRDIIIDADVMISCPPNFEEIKRGSGTWATIKFTRHAGKPLYIIYPDGKIDRERQQ